MADRTPPPPRPLADVLASADKVRAARSPESDYAPPRAPGVWDEKPAAAFAPHTAPERIEHIAKLTGETIREACASTGKSILALVEECEAEVAKARSDAESFIKQLETIGKAHGERMTMIINGIGSITQTVAAERKKIGEIANYKVEVDV